MDFARRDANRQRQPDDRVGDERSREIGEASSNLDTGHDESSNHQTLVEASEIPGARVIGPRLPFALGVRHTNRHVNDTLAEPIGPVPGDERITVIDCLRGAALFGILMANMRGFH
jgi:hypothetical protein